MLSPTVLLNHMGPPGRYLEKAKVVGKHSRHSHVETVYHFYCRPGCHRLSCAAEQIDDLLDRSVNPYKQRNLPLGLANIFVEPNNKNETILFKGLEREPDCSERDHLDGALPFLRQQVNFP